MDDDLKGVVLSACRWLLRPVVRMMLRHGVMHREFVELSKELYVDVARREYGLRGRPTNVSRTALLTGLDRKEVSRLKTKLAGIGAAGELARQQDRIARVLSGWHQDADYLDGRRKPRVIPRHGSAPSFDDLARRYGGDVPAVTILRELRRVGAVRIAAGKVTVLRRNYRLDTADPQALARAGSVLADIGVTVTHNLYRNKREPSRFEARATNTSVPVSALPAYRRFLYAEGQAFLEKVDAWLTEHQSVDTMGNEPCVRLGVGMYWIQTEQASGSSP